MTIMHFEELAEVVNEKGWFVLNCYQFDHHLWRCNLQRKATNGASENVFTQFADGKTPSEALRAALANISTAANPKKLALDKTAKARQADTLTAGQEAALTAAMTDLIDALDHMMGD